jgi:hypothetical protein
LGGADEWGTGRQPGESEQRAREVNLGCDGSGKEERQPTPVRDGDASTLCLLLLPVYFRDPRLAMLALPDLLFSYLFWRNLVRVTRFHWSFGVKSMKSLIG